MNRKLSNYVDVLFSEVPFSRKSQELKTEILSNLEERYDENLAKGMDEQEAYKAAVEALGETDEMIASLMPEKDLQEKINRYKTRRAKSTALAVVLYILGVAAIVGGATLPEVFGSSADKGVIIGLLQMFVMAAIATAMLVYTHMSIPQEVEPYFKKRLESIEVDTSTKGGRILKALLGSYWPLVTVLYLALSFFTGAWHVTWLVWLIAAAVLGAIKQFADIRHGEGGK